MVDRDEETMLWSSPLIAGCGNDYLCVFCSFLFVLISNVLNLNTMEQQDSDYSDVSDVDEEYKTSSKKKGGRG